VHYHKGKLFLTTGFNKNGTNYLFAEEVVFLLERGSLELLYQGAPCSVQSALALTRLHMDVYRLYAFLKKDAGLVIRRAQLYEHCHLPQLDCQAHQAATSVPRRQMLQT
jgi:hypothetical protein